MEDDELELGHCEECGEPLVHDDQEGCTGTDCALWDECDECGDIFETGADCGCREEYE